MLIRTLLLLTFCLSYKVSAETTSDVTQQAAETPEKHQVLILYSPGSILYRKIAQKLSDELTLKRPGIIISTAAPDKKTNTVTSKTSIVVVIGDEGIQSAENNYPEISKLFISTDPNKFMLDVDKNNNDAILYMTQSYCRQIHFIKLLNKQWKTISILNSIKKPIARKTIQQCANKNGINTYIVSISEGENLTDKIKHALNHSDVLLALPDNNIYNSRTVKNILLTSYRYRRPVIAFSKNFVNAGALAAIHSNTQQIAQSAARLVKQFFDSGMKFVNPATHPERFDIDINTQVFRALDLSIPDIDKLEQTLKLQTSDESGKLK